GLQQSGTDGWGKPLIVGSVAAAVILLGAFVVTERRVSDPLVEFPLFRTARYTGAAITAYVGNWMFGSILFFMTLYLQEVRDLSPIEAGLIFLTFTIPLVVMSPITGRMVRRYGAQQLMAA